MLVLSAWLGFNLAVVLLLVRRGPSKPTPKPKGRTRDAN